MKRPNNRMTINANGHLPITEVGDKMAVSRKRNDHRDIGNNIPAKPGEKTGLSSEHYHRAVAEMAYALWEERGHPEGGSTTDWFKAEETLKPLWSADHTA